MKLIARLRFPLLYVKKIDLTPFDNPVRHIAHNLMLILEDCLQKEGIENESENNRRNKRLEKVLGSSKTINVKQPPFLTQSKRATQRSAKFVRWLRNHLYINASWMEILGTLKRIYAAF